MTVNPMDILDQTKSPFTFVCSRWKGADERGELEHNRLVAIALCRFVVAEGRCPIAPHLYCTAFLNDNDPEERKQGIGIGHELMRRCSEIIICPTFGISAGMRDEIQEAAISMLPMRIIDATIQGVGKVTLVERERKR